VGLLPREQQIVLGLFYEEGFKLAEIGAVLGTSEQEARALYSKAVERVRAEAFVPPHRNRQAASRAAARPESSDETVS
jgi:DNA-directed RNA polymerase specialized sigma24 family protein